MAVILRQVIPDGTQWGEKAHVFPHWLNLEFGQDLIAPGSIKFDYATQGAHFDELKPGIFIVPEVNGNSSWFDSIFYINQRTGSNTIDSPGTATFSGVSLRKLLEGIRWMPAIGSTYIDSEGFRYNNASPGDVIKAGVENFWSRAKKRFKDPVHWIAAVNTSPASKWAYRLDEIIQPTTTVSEVIERYQELGVATARFYGFHLNCGHYDWYVNDPIRDKTDSVQLKVGVNLVNADYSESDTELITSLLVKGAPDPFPPEDKENLQTNTVVWVTASQAVIDKWGYHEGVLEVSDAANPTTLRAIGTNYINKHLAPRYSASYTMVDNLYDPRTGESLDTPQALVDFQCGDSILVLTERGAIAEKVYAITLSYANATANPNIGLTLNDYFESWEVKFNQRLRRLGG